MANVKTGPPPRDHVQPETQREPSDQALLERFIARGDETAFADLVRRHGKTVWGVCWRVLRQEQDVEDAFQAVFLVLARKAASIRTGEAVGSWLYGVAYRTAMKARRSAARRHNHEDRAVRFHAGQPEPWAEEASRELQRLLDDEVQRLADKYRAPFVLCCLEGMSRGEAARELGCKEGTLSGRLARARLLLQKRLARRGVMLSAALTAAALAENATFAAAQPVLIPATIKGGLTFLVEAKAPGVSPSAVQLAEAVGRTLTSARLKTALILLMSLVLVLTGVGLAALQLTNDAEVADPDTFVGPPVHLGTIVDEQVLSLALSPDGTRLVTGGGRELLPGQFQIWDTAAGKNLVTVREIPGVRALAFAPSGTSFATGDFSGHVKLRDAATGRELAVAHGHEVGVNGVAYSPDGALLVSAGLDRTLKLWDAKELREQRVFRGHTDMVFSVAFFNHAPAFISGSQDKTAIIWDVKSGERKLVLRGHADAVEAVAVAPDDKLVATSSWDRRIKLWDAVSGKEQAVLEQTGVIAYAVSFSPDGKFLAGAGADGKVRLWDVKSRKVTLEMGKHAGPVWALAFSRDGKLLASGSSDRTAKLWHLPGGKEAAKLAALSPVIRPIQALAYSPDGAYVAMATNDTAVQLRDAKTGNVVKLLAGHTGGVNCLTFAPDGRTLASGSSDMTVGLWTLATGNAKTLKGHTGEVHSLTFTPDGTRLASAGSDKVIRLWDVASGESVTGLEGHEKPVRALAVTADGRKLVSGSDDKAIKIWDLAELGGKHPSKAALTLKGHTGPIRALVVAVDGTLASASEDGTVKLWDIVQGQERLTLKGHREAVLSLAITPTGRTLASGSRDKTVRVWDCASGEARAVLKKHQGAVTSLAVHPRGKHLLSGGVDTWLLRWAGAKATVAPAVDKAAVRPNGTVVLPIPKEAPALAPPSRIGYPQEFYQDYRGGRGPRAPVSHFGADAQALSRPEDRGLRVTLPAQRKGTNTVGVALNAAVGGDFEITAGFEILAANRPKAGHGVGFELHLEVDSPAQDAVGMLRFNRLNEGDVYACSQITTQGGQRRYQLKLKPTASRSGMLRLTRKGAQVIFSAADLGDGRFREVHRFPFVTDDLKRVRLGAYTGHAPEPVDLRIVDMRIRADRLFTNRAVAPVAHLLEDNTAFFIDNLHNAGALDASIADRDEQSFFSGTCSLAVSEFQRFNPRLPNWNYVIAEKPGPGQFRYVRFAWKRTEAPGIMLQFHTTRNIWHRYYAGRISTTTQSWGPMTRVADEPPRQWELVTRDLFGDFGPMAITGIGFSAMEGPGYANFDHIYLGRTIADLDDVTARLKNVSEPAEEDNGIVWIAGGALLVFVGLASCVWLLYVRRRQTRPVAAGAQTGDKTAAVASGSGSFACPHCSKKLKARPELGGKQVKCPACGNRVTVPESENPDASAGANNSQEQAPSRSGIMKKFLLWLPPLGILGLGIALWFVAEAGGEDVKSVSPPEQQAGGDFFHDFRGAGPLPSSLKIVGPDVKTTARPEEGGLRITLPATRPVNHPVEVVTKFSLSGDFEITGSYEILSADRPSKGYGVGVSLNIATDPQRHKFAKVGRLLRAKEGSVVMTEFWTNDLPKDYQVRSVPNEARTGKLRLVREGSTIRFLAAEGSGSAFREIYRREFGTEDLSDVRFAVCDSGTPGNAVDVRLVGLEVRSRGVIPTTPADPEPAPERASRTGWKVFSVLAVLTALSLGTWLAVRRNSVAR